MGEVYRVRDIRKLRGHKDAYQRTESYVSRREEWGALLAQSQPSLLGHEHFHPQEEV
jgi:hypothetical protein